MKSYIKTVSLLVLASVCLVSGVHAENSKSNDQLTLKKLLKDKAIVAQQIEKFDELDFEIFSGQQWHRVEESHAKNILVHWPDGHTTKGIDVHIEDMKAMFVWSPDLKITKHPIKFGAENWTAVVGEMTGTFSKPMPIGGGKTIQPTGKKFAITMATLGYWENGVMTEEYLFWDNQVFMKQIGLGQ
ncbi:MAG: ester cyclase [Gammaproteobacteria bacterium]|nr:ester cyclase [Gammaproteobacteria bacterium]